MFYMCVAKSLNLSKVSKMKRFCQTCKTEFEHRKKKKYCSRECDPKRWKECETCGETFFDDTRSNQRKYCGEGCNPASRLSREKVCEYCDKTFTDDSKQNTMRFCDASCRRKAKDIRLAKKNGGTIPDFLDEQTRHCMHCGADYTPSDVSQKYCTTDCRDEAYALRKYKSVPAHLSRFVTCLECGKEFQGCIPHGGRSGNHFEDAHNMTVSEYQKKYNGAAIYSEASSWKMRASDREFPDDFSERCRDAQLKRYEKEIVWNKGMSSETHPSIRRQSETMLRNAQKEGYVNGFSGLKHDPSVLDSNAEAQRVLKYDFVYCRNWNEGKERAAKLGAHISEPHVALIQALRNANLWYNYEFEYEKWLTIDGMPHGIDIATKTPFKLAIEVDGCRYHGCADHGNYEKLDEKYQLEVDEQRARDRRVDLAYKNDGWEFLRFWEHDVRQDLPGCVKKVCEILGAPIPNDLCSYSEVIRSLDIDLMSVLAKKVFLTPNDMATADVEDIFRYYQVRGFPYPTHSSSEIQQDFEMLCKYDVSKMLKAEDVLVQKRRGLGMKGPNYFMRNFYEARRKGGRSMLDVFNTESSLMSVIRSRKKHAKNGLVSDSTMRTGLRLAASAPSSFPATIAKSIYQRFLNGPSKVLDPCAGFGGRMVASQSLPFEVNYVGVDPWTENVKNLRQMLEWFEFEGCDILHSPFEQVDLDSESFDFVFTSPPHFDKELYSDEPTQSVSRYSKYEKWRIRFLSTLIQKSYSAIKDGGCLVLHVSKMGEVNFVDDVRRLMAEVGFSMLPEVRWEMNTFLNERDTPRYEYFIVGKKVPA